MKPRRIRPSALDAVLSTRIAVGLVGGVGTQQLAGGFLATMQQLMPLTFCTVFAIDATGRVVTVSAASSYGDAAALTSARYIASRFDLLDPNMVWLAARKLPAAAQLWLSHQRAEEVADLHYRAICYGDVGIRERASVLLLLPQGQRAAVSFYRSLAQQPFSAADFALIERHAALLAEATAAHSRQRAALNTPASAASTAFHDRLLLLTPREREVVGHLMAGKTAKQAAREVGVELSTLRTYQYRAFRRLEVGSIKELLRLSHATPPG